MKSDKHMESSEHEYLKELSPKLFGQKMNISQGAPDGYFEDLPEKVMDKIDQREGSISKAPGWVNWKNLGLAAGLALAIGLVQYFWYSQVETAPTEAHTAVRDLSNQELNEFLLEDDIYELYSSEDLEMEGFGLDQSDEEIANYLLSEEITEEMLYEAL